MSAKTAIVIFRASYRKGFSAIFRRVTFSATGDSTSLRRLVAFARHIVQNISTC